MSFKSSKQLPLDVIDTHPKVYPRYLLSPFNTEHIHINHKIYLQNKNSRIKQDFLDKYFTDSKLFSYLTKRGQECISLILLDLKLKKQDDICIFNTSGSPYISSCVTKEIEKICNWSREIT